MEPEKTLPSEQEVNTVGYCAEVPEEEVNVSSQPEQFNLTAFLQQRQEFRKQVSAVMENIKNKPKFDRKDTMKVIYKLHQLVDHLDSLTEIVLQDLMVIDQRFRNHEEKIMVLSNNHLVLRAVLEEKGVVTKEDIERIWKDKIKPELEAKILEAKQEAEKAMQPETGLVDLDGNPLKS